MVTPTKTYAPRGADRTALAYHAVCSERTIDRVYAGERTTSQSQRRVADAARKLGLPLPAAAKGVAA